MGGLYSLFKANGLVLTFDLMHCSQNIHSLSQENSFPNENGWPLAQSQGPTCFREIYNHRKEKNYETQTLVLKN